VTFTAPASGPSGIFASSGTSSVVVGTDDTGSATAPQLTANTVAGSYQVTASSTYGSVTFSLVNTAAGLPATVVALAPRQQSATASSPYPAQLQAKVLDANGTPVLGATVTFALGTATGQTGAGTGLGSSSGTTGSGSGSAGATFVDGSAQATETTGASGVAVSPRLTAAGTVGTATATATVQGTNSAATFQLRTQAVQPPTIHTLTRRRLWVTVGQRYRHPLKVRVRDGHGNPLEGATVTFTLGAGTQTSASGQTTAASSSAGATFVGGSGQATETTNASGVAVSPRLTADTTAGTFTATATITTSNRAAGFQLKNVAGPPATLTAGAAATESTGTGHRFPILLAVTVTDADGNPVTGTRVTFAAPVLGAGGSFRGRRTVTVRTNQRGIALAPPFTANQRPGGYVVMATTGHAHRTAFALVNEQP
jgi:protocatechuate 3,4-dioxygenase beta subunit